jgi:hypothetical protein
MAMLKNALLTRNLCPPTFNRTAGILKGPIYKIASPDLYFKGCAFMMGWFLIDYLKTLTEPKA